MKIALYKNLEYNYETVLVTEGMEDNASYVQISEVVDIEFKKLPDDVVVNAQVDSLKEMKKKAQADCEVKTQAIDAEIGKLLAITDESK